MLTPLLCLLLTAALATGSYFAWARWFVPREVRINKRDIDANGSQDSLRKKYHAYRNKVRGAYLVGLSALGAAPAIFYQLLPGLVVFAALGLLLLGYFAYTFTPALNEARKLPEFHASFDSASWPDAAVVKKIRATAAAYPKSYAALDPQLEADHALGLLLLQVWFWCRIGCGVLAVASIILSITHAKV